MLYAHKILAGRAEPRLTGIGGISSLKASSGVEEGLEGFLAGGDGHRRHISKLVGETKGGADELHELHHGLVRHWFERRRSD